MRRSTPAWPPWSAQSSRASLLLDQERVEARHGKSRVRDDRMWYMASLPFSDTFLPVLAAEYLRVIRPLKGLTRKCIVLDLDNTLWGGVVGEDGLQRHQTGRHRRAGQRLRRLPAGAGRPAPARRPAGPVHQEQPGRRVAGA